MPSSQLPIDAEWLPMHADRSQYDKILSRDRDSGTCEVGVLIFMLVLCHRVPLLTTFTNHKVRRIRRGMLFDHLDSRPDQYANRKGKSASILLVSALRSLSIDCITFVIASIRIVNDQG